MKTDADAVFFKLNITAFIMIDSYCVCLVLNTHEMNRLQQKYFPILTNLTAVCFLLMVIATVLWYSFSFLVRSTPSVALGIFAIVQRCITLEKYWGQKKMVYLH